MRIKQNLPNFITAGNLLCGCLGIIVCLNAGHQEAGIFIVFAAILDFLDGAVARALKVSSPIGKDLDSLADVVTFGVLPGFMAMGMIKNASNISYNLNLEYLAFIGLIIPILSAFRLANFNHDDRQSDTFIGLPTPANAIFFTGLSWGIYSGVFSFLNHPIILAMITLVMAFLLIAELPMFSLKIKSKKIADYKLPIIFLLISLVSILILKQASLSFIIIIFILLSIINNLFKK